MTSSSGTDEPTGRLGAVLRSVGQQTPVSLGRRGPWLATTLEDARRVLTTPDVFDFPTDASRRPLGSPGAEEGSSRSQHAITPPLDPGQVGRGAQVFADELASASSLAPTDLDAMVFLREPVARSTTSALLPDLAPADRDRIADLVLGWIDALGPVIAATRPPSRWSRARRHEDRARSELVAALGAAGCDRPAGSAVVLAAGIQVPVAAGAWLLVKLAEDPLLAEALRARPDLDRAVAWETVRLCPPTWITARVTTQDTELGEVSLPAWTVVMVSPLLLGRLATLAPETDQGTGTLDRFDPFRWDQDRVRPGAWLPFGAGPHACPGRNLGLAQLSHLAGWARARTLTSLEQARTDQSRGIFPNPSRLRVSDLPGTED